MLRLNKNILGIGNKENISCCFQRGYDFLSHRKKLFKSRKESVTTKDRFSRLKLEIFAGRILSGDDLSFPGGLY